MVMFAYNFHRRSHSYVALHSFWFRSAICVFVSTQFGPLTDSGGRGSRPRNSIRLSMLVSPVCVGLVGLVRCNSGVAGGKICLLSNANVVSRRTRWGCLLAGIFFLSAPWCSANTTGGVGVILMQSRGWAKSGSGEATFVSRTLWGR